jgi:2-polyprenyl-6-methoxyphenol hydroxylase-like FAD-dependent oxidoreductase
MPDEVDVLIVGAGPVGLFLALQLVRRNVRCAVVERNDGLSSHSKALALMARTLEIFEMAGIVAPFVSAGNRVSSVTFTTPVASTRVELSSIASDYPYVLILPQNTTETLLHDALRAAGGDVAFGWQFETYREEDNVCVAAVSRDGALREIRARYVVGCDGARSTVRTAAGIGFAGRSYAEETLLADVPIETPIPLNEARVYLRDGATLTVFPISAAIRRIVVVAASETLPSAPGREWLQSRIDTHGPADTRVGAPVWTSTFRVHRRVAARLRSGRVFLAGDAAHIHSPVGGQGMNTGLQDAWNLAWKLGYALGRAAPEGLLDSYEAERLPVARAIVAQTDALTKLVAHPALRTVRERFAPFAARIGPLQRYALAALAELNLSYAKSPIVCSGGARIPNQRLADGSKLYESLRGGFAVLETRRAGEARAQLVRPDGYVAFEAAGTGDATSRARAALAGAIAASTDELRRLELPETPVLRSA